VIGIELTKQLRRPRGWVTLGAMAAIPVFLTLVIGLSRPSIAERIGNYGSVVTNTSGFSLPLIALSAMLLFLLPLGVAVFAGETMAAEAAWGSLRYLLVRPVPRWRVLAAKAVVAAGYSIGAVVLVSVTALVSGVLAFGWHSLTVIDLQNTSAFHLASATFSPVDLLIRLALSDAFIIATLASTFGFALLLSTLSSHPFSAVAGGVGLSLFSRALDNVPGLHPLGPWLPATDTATTLWTGFFTSPAQSGGVGHVLAVQAVYTGVFLTAAFAWVRRVDILI
jgi:ABC-2 type transport system permease protein